MSDQLIKRITSKRQLDDNVVFWSILFDEKMYGESKLNIDSRQQQTNLCLQYDQVVIQKKKNTTEFHNNYYPLVDSWVDC